MKRKNYKIIQIAIMLFVFQMMLPTLMAQPIPTSNGPVGSIINVSDSGVVKYWNDTAWIAVTPGLPGQSLQFTNGIPAWIDGPLTPLRDIDGNIYDTVHIGTQIWMKQNLNVTHYRNGDAIPNVTAADTWTSLTTGAYCYYNNDAGNATTYGGLYNYYTVVDSRKLCPTGWHIPSDADWTILTDYLGGESIAGNKLKEAGLTHWQSYSADATNETGFTALPGGGFDNIFLDLGYNGYWWSSTEFDATNAWRRDMYRNSAIVNRLYWYKSDGYAVRCINDSVIHVIPKPVIDIDGNGYDTVHIGTQIWMKQNLKVTHYRNGDAIPNVTDGSWGYIATGAYCNYDNNNDNAVIYGRLYNYYTIEDARNLCPVDWHVSATSEWTTLSTYLGGEDVAANKLKELGTTHWAYDLGSTNETGFTALPCGFTFNSGGFGYFGHYGIWWSTPEESPTNAHYWFMDAYSSPLGLTNGSKNYGFSVRCVKD